MPEPATVTLSPLCRYFFCSALAPYGAVDPSGFVFASTSGKAEFSNLRVFDLFDFRVFA